MPVSQETSQGSSGHSARTETLGDRRVSGQEQPGGGFLPRSALAHGGISMKEKSLGCLRWPVQGRGNWESRMRGSRAE